MQAITSALRAHGRRAAVLLALAAALSAVCAGPAAASTTYSAADANPRPIPWTGWNGVPIQHPHKAVSPALLKRAKFPRSWRGGAVRFGSGYRIWTGSQRVREVQRRLTRLGYHTGPIDGLLGPLTRSSIQWFQIKHGLRPTGVVAASTLAFLRHPKNPTGGLEQHAKKQPAPAPAPKPTPTQKPKPKATPSAPVHPVHHGTPGWLVPVLIVLGLALAAAAFVLLRGRRSAGPASEPPVIGYVSTETTNDAESQAAAMAAACERRGWTLEQVFHDWDTKAPSFRRPALAEALARLGSRSASRLVVNELEQLAASLDELQFVLAWFMEEEGVLTALDVDLDTDTPEGHQAVAEVLQLRVIDHADERVGRIRRMRGQGMTFQAIADKLNAEGVEAPTQDEWWRPSSVRFVLETARSRAGSRSP
jgi:peptidoglycan hydrolase-like protein with peptidoglycan-binding domain